MCRPTQSLCIWTQLAFDGPVGCVPELLAHYTYLVDNVSLGIPVCEWAGETERLTERIADRYRASSEDSHELVSLTRSMKRYVARTTARLMNELWGPTQGDDVMLVGIDYLESLLPIPFAEVPGYTA